MHLKPGIVTNRSHANHGVTTVPAQIQNASPNPKIHPHCTNYAASPLILRMRSIRSWRSEMLGWFTDSTWLAGCCLDMRSLQHTQTNLGEVRLGYHISLGNPLSIHMDPARCRIRKYAVVMVAFRQLYECLRLYLLYYELHAMTSSPAVCYELHIELPQTCKGVLHKHQQPLHACNLHYHTALINPYLSRGRGTILHNPIHMVPHSQWPFWVMSKRQPRQLHRLILQSMYRGQVRIGAGQQQKLLSNAVTDTSIQHISRSSTHVHHCMTYYN
jgi:hypothetical protein